MALVSAVMIGLLIVTGCSSSQQFSLYPNFIFGHVYQSDTGTPIAGAQIQYSICKRLPRGGAACSKDVRILFTNSDGSYVIGNVEPGTYSIRASAEGYDHIYGSLLDIFAFGIVPLDFRMNKLNVVTGRVYDSKYLKPIAGAKIVFTPKISDFQLGTDSNGNFRADVLPGEYTVRAEAKGYITKYYSGASSADNATRLVIKANNDITDIDFALDSGYISGQVHNPDGTPASKATVFYRQIGSIYASPVGTSSLRSYKDQYNYVNTGTDGKYVISGLLNIGYELQAESEDEILHTSQPVMVSATVGKETSADLGLVQRRRVIGHIYETDNKTPAADIKIFIYSPIGKFSKLVASAVTSNDGSYFIPDLSPGEYKFCLVDNGSRFGDNPGKYGTEGPLYHDICYGYPEEKIYRFPSDSPIIVTKDLITTVNLRIPRFCTIIGRIYDIENDQPIAGALITTGSCSYPPLRSYRSDTNGVYQANRVCAGEWILWAWAPGYIPRYYGGAYNVENATEVITMWSDVIKNVDFGLQKGGKITGHVYNKDGSPISKGSIDWRAKEANPFKPPYAYTKGWSEFIDPNEAPIYSSISSDGSYTIDGLISGDYEWITAPSVVVHVNTGETVYQDIVLP
ncbi:MAG: carboxypeptidase-like regulatory domain-containing protein [Dehalococcoidia bacterium]|nr:carboxypeptidase-like regulatory domain-containing protein [Dehalococcoidia bacterium]